MEKVALTYNPRIILDTGHKPPRKRIWELDFLRGVCILLMVFDHTIFNFGATFAEVWTATGRPELIKLVEFSIWYWDHPARIAVQEAVLWTFFSLCGASVLFSRNNLRHAVKILICAGIISIAIEIMLKLGMDKGYAIRFGVLHMLGVSSLVVAIVYAFTRKNRWVASGVFIALAVALILLDELYLQKGRWYADLPWMCMFHENLGSVEKFSPGDYFPLIPNIVRVFAGAAIAPLLYYKKRSLLPRLEGCWHRPINFFGRHTLLIVILHQPIIVGAIALINYIFLTPGSFSIF